MINEAVRLLMGLRTMYPGHATQGWIKDVAAKVVILEGSGRTHFGGAHVLAWYLTERARKGDTFLQLTSYLWQLWAERMPVGVCQRGHTGPQC
jgi:hypothetical protein